jgi:hypothetical protein
MPINDIFDGVGSRFVIAKGEVNESYPLLPPFRFIVLCAFLDCQFNQFNSMSYILQNNIIGNLILHFLLIYHLVTS